MHFSTWAQCFNCKSCLYSVKVKFRLEFFNLRYLSQILKHLGDFPLPQCWFGYYSHLSGPKYMWLNILGKQKGTFEWEQRWEEWMQYIFEKIQEKQFLFQRFVTQIVGWFSISLVS